MTCKSRDYLFNPYLELSVFLLLFLKNFFLFFKGGNLQIGIFTCAESEKLLM